MTTEPPPPIVDSGPYRVDVTITLPSGARVRLMGNGLDAAGMREMLDLINRSVPDG